MKNKKTLHVCKTTGNYEKNIIRLVLRFVSKTIALIIIAIISTMSIIYSNMASILELWIIPLLFINLSIVSIIIRRRIKNKPLVSIKKARKFNIFFKFVDWLENRYRDVIDVKSERTSDDIETSTTLYCQLIDNAVKLGLYEETGRSKIKIMTGEEFINIIPVELYTDFILNNGVGYIFIKPTLKLISKIRLIDERIINRTLREIGLNGWKVENASYDNDDLIFFILKNEEISRAFNFCEKE